MPVTVCVCVLLLFQDFFPFLKNNHFVVSLKLTFITIFKKVKTQLFFAFQIQMTTLRAAISSFDKANDLRPTVTTIRFADGSVYKSDKNGKEDFLEKVEVGQTVTTLELPIETTSNHLMGKEERSMTTTTTTTTTTPSSTTIDLPWPGLQAFILDDILTAKECTMLIDATESVGYEQSHVNVGGKLIVLKNVVDSASCVIDDVNFATEIFHRIYSFVPLYLPDPMEPGWEGEVCGINPLFRFLRYGAGAEGFTSHRDNSTHLMDEHDERSLLTVVIYLNEGYEGGETRFCQHLNVHAVHEDVLFTTPVKCGTVLLFHHDCIHDVAGNSYIAL